MCGSLKSVLLPPSLKVIESDAFYQCESLTGITVPDTTWGLQNRAFSGCTSLNNMMIPDSVEILGSEVFKDCPNLKILCYENSYIQHFAEDEGIPYQIVEKKQTETSSISSEKEAETSTEGFHTDIIVKQTIDANSKKASMNSATSKHNTDTKVEIDNIASNEDRLKPNNSTELVLKTMEKPDHPIVAIIGIVCIVALAAAIYMAKKRASTDE